MSRKIIFSVFMSLLLSACGGGSSSTIDKSLDEGKPLVRVGDEKIHEGYLNLLQRVNPGIKAQLDMPMGKKRLVDNLVEQELFYQESLKRGLDKKAAVREKADLYRRVIIAQSLLDDEVDKTAKSYYDKNKDKEFERVKVSHIFFSGLPKMPAPTPGKPPTPPTEEERKNASQEAEAKAKEAYERLKKGDSWDKVVQEMSDDKGSASRGGDMGYLTHGDRRIDRLDYKGIVDAAFSLSKGAYSQPIEAKDGWHIIEVTEDKVVQPYDDVAMQIKFKMRGETKNNLLNSLKEKMKIQYLDVSLAESAPSMPMPPPMAPPSAPPPAAPESKAPETGPGK
jgi:hypothetical protein